MTLHLHPEFVPGCFRCDLSREELADIEAEETDVDAALRRIREQQAEIARRLGPAEIRRRLGLPVGIRYPPPVPRTAEEQREFARAWDARVEAAWDRDGVPKAQRGYKNRPGS